MATKGIYTKIDGVYYNLVQDCSSPTTIFSMPGTHSQMTVESTTRHVTSSVWVNPLCKDTIQTNKEAYDEMIECLRENKVTQIDNIHNRYMVYVDYSVYNAAGNEVNHNVTSKEVEAVDAMYLLGVGRDNELVYKQIKSIVGDINFSVKNAYPFGIMSSCTNDMYKLVINDISLYQDMIYGSNFTDKHYSCSENCYAYGSHTIASSLRNMRKIYSTSDGGIVISAVEVPFTPRSITIKLHVALDNVIVAYDVQNVKDVIIENIHEKYCLSTEDPEEPVTPVIPEGEKYPEANGNREPGSDGTFDYYQLVPGDTEGSLLVVEDFLDVETGYDTEKMIHKSMVIADIPCVEVGLYVKYIKVYPATEDIVV